MAPTWTRVVNTHTVFTFGGFVRQDQYNYYPSDDPFADLQPDLQLQTIGQNRTLTSAGLRASVSYAKGIHNLKAGIIYEDTILTEKDAFGVVDPTAECGVSECGWQPLHGRRADGSRAMHRAAFAESELSIRCWPVTT